MIIENFRSVRNLSLNFKDLSMIIGENNSGKTNILKALSLFFSSSLRGMCEEDFCDKNLKNEIRITVTFDRLTPTESSNIRVRRYLSNGELIVQKSFRCDPETSKYESTFSGLIREPKLEFLKVSKFDDYKADIEKIVRDNKLPDYFRNDKGNVTQASYKEGLSKYLDENGDKIVWDEPYFSSTQFLGWPEVARDFLPHFFYVPAVMEASDEAQYREGNLFGRLIDSLFLEGAKDFPELNDLIKKVETNLNRPVEGEDKRPEKFRKFEGALLSALKESMPSIRDAEIKINVPKIQDIVQSGTELLLDDGIKTSVQSKGHGLQRALIFAIFREYAKLRKAEKEEREAKPLIFAIEEPELYLHPHRQIALFEILRTLSSNDQIVFCTHSPYFIDMSKYDAVVLVSKPDPDTGTRAFQCEKEVFTQSEKDQFRLVNEFSTERNEMFFARKVILVEGPSEKISLPVLGKKIGLDFNDAELSIVECNGKANITFFMKVLNAFQINYLVIHDVDPINDEEEDERKKRHRAEMFKYNQKIAETLDPSFGNIVSINPEFDELLGVPRHQVERFGKRFAVFSRCNEITLEEIPEELKGIVRNCVPDIQE